MLSTGLVAATNLDDCDSCHVIARPEPEVGGRSGLAEAAISVQCSFLRCSGI